MAGLAGCHDKFTFQQVARLFDSDSPEHGASHFSPAKDSLISRKLPVNFENVLPVGESPVECHGVSK